MHAPLFLFLFLAVAIVPSICTRMENPSIHGCGHPFSSLDYCSYAVARLPFPALQLHIVRMEPGSCDAVAFRIDDLHN